MNNIFLIVGLGNPGKDYIKTRHNVGFMLLDFIKDSLRISGEFAEEAKFQSEILLTENESTRIIFAKPNTFMNKSGSSVSKLLSYYKIQPENLIVIFDDLDIELGKFKIQNEKSPRQHNGHNSIVNTVGNVNFNRVRIGIENRGEKRHLISGHDYVLSRFTTEEINLLDKQVFPNVTENIMDIIQSYS